jgi:hypothetical protein
VRGSEFPAFSFRYPCPIRSNRSIVDAKILCSQPLARNSRFAFQLSFRQRVCAPAGDIVTYDADNDAAAARACWECRRVVQTPWPFKVVAVAFAPKYLSFSSVCSSSPELIAAVILRGALCPEGSLLIFGVFVPNASAFLVAQGALAAPARMRHP